MNKLSLQMAEQFSKALRLFAATLTNEQAIEVAYVYDPWYIDKTYMAGEFLTYGKNSVGDPQLYKVVQAHTSSAEWIPDVTPTLYSPIGLSPDGVAVWSRPTGAHDAYNNGDIVVHNGIKYISIIDGNVWEPSASQTDFWKVV